MDCISELPDPLICRILLNLPTKDAVQSSVLSSRWRNLWKSVPGLVLDDRHFPDERAFLSFLDRFLGFNSQLQTVTLSLEYVLELEDVNAHFRCINTVLKRKVKHLELYNYFEYPMHLTTLYTCESLVTLTLESLTLSKPDFISLPSLKVMKLDCVEIEDTSDFEMLISGCSVLERLTFCWQYERDVEILRVCSKSLLSFTHVIYGANEAGWEDLVTVIDASRLKYLKLTGYENPDFMMKSFLPSLEYVDIQWPLSGDAEPMKLVRYFLEKSKVLKKLTLDVTLYAYHIHKELHAIPRLSPSCQVILL